MPPGSKSSTTLSRPRTADHQADGAVADEEQAAGVGSRARTPWPTRTGGRTRTPSEFVEHPGPRCRAGSACAPENSRGEAASGRERRTAATPRHASGRWGHRSVLSAGMGRDGSSSPLHPRPWHGRWPLADRRSANTERTPNLGQGALGDRPGTRHARRALPDGIVASARSGTAGEHGAAGRSRAQSGRRAAKRSRPGCSS